MAFFIPVFGIEKIPVFHDILAIHFNNTIFGDKNQYPKLDMYIPQVKVSLGKQVIITNSYWNRYSNLKLHTVYCKLALWSHLNHQQTANLNSKTWCLASLKAQYTYANIKGIFESQYLWNGLMKILWCTVFQVYCPALVTTSKATCTSNHTAIFLYMAQLS